MTLEEVIWGKSALFVSWIHGEGLEAYYYYVILRLTAKSDICEGDLGKERAVCVLNPWRRFGRILLSSNFAVECEKWHLRRWFWNECIVLFVFWIHGEGLEEYYYQVIPQFSAKGDIWGANFEKECVVFTLYPWSGFGRVLLSSNSAVDCKKWRIKRWWMVSHLVLYSLTWEYLRDLSWAPFCFLYI